MRPAFDDPALAHERRDGVPRIEADAAPDRDPVAPLDGRDRVELDAHRPPDRGLDVVGVGAPETRRIA